MRPLIGVTSDYSASDPGQFWLREEYAAAVWDAGGWPVILPPLEGVEIADIVGRLEGLVVSGGDFDIEPAYYKEEPIPELGKLNPRRSRFELALCSWAMEHNLPTLGICGGIQAINVAGGGTLVQDLEAQLPMTLSHQQPRCDLSHPVGFEASSLLAGLLGQNEAMVNSTHHQVVKDAAAGFKVSAAAPDGLIEAIESENHSFILGIQWHPEALYKKNPLWLKPFSGLVQAASEFFSLK